MDKISEFFEILPLWAELLIIFFSRIIEVSMGTLRIILINKGYRKQGVVLAFFEVLIWVFVASRVISGIAETPIKGIVYSIGFATGVYAGSRLESRLAFGKVLIQVITTIESGIIISDVLRDLGYGVTSLAGKGKDSERTVIMIYANRKGKEIIINKVNEIDQHAMIVSNDVSTLQGGFLRQYVK